MELGGANKCEGGGFEMVESINCKDGFSKAENMWIGNTFSISLHSTMIHDEQGS